MYLASSCPLDAKHELVEAADVIGIDEGQFFPDLLVHACVLMLCMFREMW